MFLTSAVDGGEWSLSQAYPLYHHLGAGQKNVQPINGGGKLGGDTLPCITLHGTVITHCCFVLLSLPLFRLPADYAEDDRCIKVYC